MHIIVESLSMIPKVHHQISILSPGLLIYHYLSI